MTRREQGRVACLALLLAAAGCHSVVLKPVTLTPAPSVATPRLSIEVDRVGASRDGCITETAGCVQAHLGVGVRITNPGPAPATVRIDDAKLMVTLQPSDPRSARAVETTASGLGRLPVDIDDRSAAEPITLGAGATLDVWADFSGFEPDADSGYRARVTLVVPFDTDRPDQAEIVLVDPAAAAPRWELEPLAVGGVTVGGVWMNVPGRGTIDGVPATDRDIFAFQLALSSSRHQWFFRYAFSFGWLTGTGSRDDNDDGFGTSFQIGRAFSRRGRGNTWLSWAPTAGFESGIYRDDDPGEPGHETTIFGVQAGVSLLIDRDRPSSGALPLAPLSPRYGSLAGLQLVYVHWFGEVLSAPIGNWGGPGFMLNAWVGLNLW